MNTTITAKLIAYTSAGLIAFFSPIIWALWVVIALVVADTMLGIMAAGKETVKNISSRRMFSLVPKLVAYLIFVILAHAVSFIEPQIPFVKLVLFGVAWIEVKSVDENFTKLVGYSFINKVLEAFKKVKNFKR